MRRVYPTMVLRVAYVQSVPYHGPQGGVYARLPINPGGICAPQAIHQVRYMRLRLYTRWGMPATVPWWVCPLLYHGG